MTRTRPQLVSVEIKVNAIKPALHVVLTFAVHFDQGGDAAQFDGVNFLHRRVGQTNLSLSPLNPQPNESAVA
jgi:hypothetical protein